MKLWTNCLIGTSASMGRGMSSRYIRSPLYEFRDSFVDVTCRNIYSIDKVVFYLLLIMSQAELKARKRSDYGFQLEYRTRWYVPYSSKHINLSKVPVSRHETERGL